MRGDATDELVEHGAVSARGHAVYGASSAVDEGTEVVL